MMIRTFHLKFIPVVFFAVLCYGCDAQHTGKQAALKNTNVYPIAFYNLENLFDTEDDPLTDDDEFTPTGAMRYTNTIYRQRLHNTASVLQILGSERSTNGAALIGVAEVENDKVLKDLLSQPEIKSRGYKYAWHNSDDPRGIDVALIYNPALFKLIRSQKVPVTLANMGGKEHTRDVLYVVGLLGTDTLHVLVNHWPSRREGVDETSPKRAAAARANREVIDNIKRVHPNAHIIVMGDLNDNPADKSVMQVLDAGDEHATLYNPWVEILKSGEGTEIFKRKWNLFDQVIISASLHGRKGLHYDGAVIEKRDFMLLHGKWEGQPKRAFRGTYWNNGYSDHLPVVVYLKR